MKLANLSPEGKQNILAELEKVLANKWSLPPWVVSLLISVLRMFLLDKLLELLDRILPSYWYNFITDTADGIATKEDWATIKKEMSKSLAQKFDIPIVSEANEEDIAEALLEVIYHFAQKGYSVIKN